MGVAAPRSPLSPGSCRCARRCRRRARGPWMPSWTPSRTACSRCRPTWRSPWGSMSGSERGTGTPSTVFLRVRLLRSTPPTTPAAATPTAAAGPAALLAALLTVSTAPPLLLFLRAAAVRVVDAFLRGAGLRLAGALAVFALPPEDRFAAVDLDVPLDRLVVVLPDVVPAISYLPRSTSRHPPTRSPGSGRPGGPRANREVAGDVGHADTGREARSVPQRGLCEQAASRDVAAGPSRCDAP